MPDHDRVRLRSDEACMVVLVEPHVLAGEIRRLHGVAPRRELARERLEAPAAVPRAVDQDEPGHAAF